MADVRALLKEQQLARRISHPHVTYSTTGRLICLICNLQLKSESLWTGHQRSPNHQKKLKEAQENPDNSKKPPSDESESSSTKTVITESMSKPPSLKRGQDEQPPERSLSPSKKRKAQRDESINEEVGRGDALSKRRRSQVEPVAAKAKYTPSLPGFLPAGFFDNASEQPKVADEEISEQQPPKTPAAKKDNATPPMPNGEFTLASRPLTPMDTSRSASGSSSKPLTPMNVGNGTPTKNQLSRSSTLATITSAGDAEDEKKEKESTETAQEVDADEWAAFEADIATAEAMPEEAVITAAPVSAEDLANMTVEETYLSKRERIEREREQEKEDAINKILDEQAEMQELEARVAKLKARTEQVRALRQKAKEEHRDDKPAAEASKAEDEDEDDDSGLDEDDEDWLRG